jgi:uncharacterized DUF497 family protein
MGLRFEWDGKKARQNILKHGISFENAATVFGDALSLTIPDPLHSTNEDRFVTIGMTENDILLVVVHAARESAIRIISAREATLRERRNYEKAP